MKKWLLLLTLVMIAGSTRAQEPDFPIEDDDFESVPPSGPIFGDPGNPGGFVPPGQATPPPPGTFDNQPAPGANATPPAPGSFEAPRGGGSANTRFNAAKKRPAPKLNEAGPEDLTNENYPELIDSFDYPNAEIADVIKAISELTGKNFIVDPAVRGKITVIAPTRITVAEAYKAFLSALAINGFSVVPSGKFLKVIPGRQAQRDSIDIYSGAYTPNTDQMITRIIQLKYISAADFNKYLGRMTTKDGIIEVYEPTNTVILSDYGSNVQRIMKIVSQIDIQGFEEQMAVIRIKYAKATDIADLIDQIINKGKGTRGKGNNAFTAGIPRFGAPEGGKGAQAFSLVIPDERINSIIVVGNKEGIDKIRNLTRQLDVNIPFDEAGGVYVYYVKHGDADKISEQLNGITKNENKTDPNKPNIPPPMPIGDPFGNGMQSAPVASGGSMFSGDVKVVHVKETSTLVIKASKQDYRAVLNLLRRLDVARRQVFVEAIIMEMGVDGNTSWGINYLQFNKETKGVGRTGFVSDSKSLATILNPIGGSGAILGFGSGDTFEITNPAGGSPLKVSSLVGFLNFLKQNTSVNILSTPQIMALDNKKAIIEVGDKIPVANNSSQTTTGSVQNSVQFEEATIKLELTPNLAPRSDVVRLAVIQTVKDLSNKVVQAKTLADSAVSTSTRKVETSIVVNSGDTAVLGGLMTEKEQVVQSKIPLLGDIPIFGWLFKSNQNTKQKVNLLVFITPRIIDTPTDHDTLLNRKMGQRVKFIKDNMGGKDDMGETIDEVIGKRQLRQPQSIPQKSQARGKPLGSRK